jgi:hypothetical protein
LHAIRVKGGTRVLQEGYKRVTIVLQGCYKSVTRGLQEVYKCVTRMLQGCYKVICARMILTWRGAMRLAQAFTT